MMYIKRSYKQSVSDLDQIHTHFTYIFLDSDAIGEDVIIYGHLEVHWHRREESQGLAEDAIEVDKIFTGVKVGAPSPKDPKNLLSSPGLHLGMRGQQERGPAEGVSRRVSTSEDEIEDDVSQGLVRVGLSLIVPHAEEAGEDIHVTFLSVGNRGPLLADHVSRELIDCLDTLAETSLAR
jgi:hypothetical protein